MVNLVPSPESVMEILQKTNAYRKGHFVYPSGKHASQFAEIRDRFDRGRSPLSGAAGVAGPRGGCAKARVGTVLARASLSRARAPSPDNQCVAGGSTASRVGTLIQNFYQSRYPGETLAQNQIRITWDDSINTLFVQASPAGGCLIVPSTRSGH